MLKVSKLHFKSHIKETSYCVKIKVPSGFFERRRGDKIWYQLPRLNTPLNRLIDQLTGCTQVNFYVYQPRVKYTYSYRYLIKFSLILTDLPL
jgi:hypothetical protein